MSDWRLSLFPRYKREWGEAYLVEFGDRARLGKLIIYSWYSTIKGGDIVKTVVTTTSVVNLMFGVSMVGLYALAGPNPPFVAVTALCLMAQGGYTLWFIYGRTPSRFEPWPRRVLLSGETLALLVGVGGFVGATLQTAQAAVDPEYAPIALTGLFTAQAVATVYLYAIRGDDSRVLSS
jgi:hypothetical protein